VSRKQLTEARESKRELAGLLISAQEKERSRLASELHDDFSQRLALLAMEIETAADSVAESGNGVGKRFNSLINSASEIGADLHTLSHRLHSSTLESLGLSAAIRAMCKEFSTQQDIQVDLVCTDIPRTVPADTALSAFRIVQEGLRNAKKYSGVKRVAVIMTQVDQALSVAISDEGNGFDLVQIRTKEGIGIRSMQERAHLLGGDFKISSAPGKGTRIEARLPIHTA
jgi:signal transduction histidine kinase